MQVEGEAQSFLDHIRLGVETAAADPTALLLFSGGQTRKAAGPRSEGLSYWMAAEAAGWFGHEDVRGRAYTEVRALAEMEKYWGHFLRLQLGWLTQCNFCVSPCLTESV